MRTLVFCSFLLLFLGCSQKSDKIAEIDAFIDARSRYKLNAHLRYHNYFFGLNKQSTFNQHFSVSGVHATYDSEEKRLNSISIEYYPHTNSTYTQIEIIDFNDSNNIIKIHVLNDEQSPQRQASYYFTGSKLFHTEKNGIEIENLNIYLHDVDSIHTMVKTRLIREGLILAK